MKQQSSGRSLRRRNAAVPSAITEIVVAIVASAIMTLMVAGGGIAAERMASIEASAIDAAPDEPPPLSWREST